MIKEMHYILFVIAPFMISILVLRNLYFKPCPAQLAFQTLSCTPFISTPPTCANPYFNPCPAQLISSIDTSVIAEHFLALYKTTNFRIFQSLCVCKHRFKFYKMLEIFLGRKCCSKKKIAHYEQFLLSLQSFQKTYTADM